MLNMAKERILVADARKFSRVVFASVAPLSAIHKIVTDASLDATIVKRLQEMNIEVILA
jgi:DeoR/GlpR family transcriptional regulator of sugar metabolism